MCTRRCTRARPSSYSNVLRGPSASSSVFAKLKLRTRSILWDSILVVGGQTIQTLTFLPEPRRSLRRRSASAPELDLHRQVRVQSGSPSWASAWRIKRTSASYRHERSALHSSEFHGCRPMADQQPQHSHGCIAGDCWLMRCAVRPRFAGALSISAFAP